MTDEVSHQVQFPGPGSAVYRIAPVDGPDMSNLGHRSKKVYGSNQPTIEALHEYVRSYGKSLGVHPQQNRKAAAATAAAARRAFARTATTEGGR